MGVHDRDWYRDHHRQLEAQESSDRWRKPGRLPLYLQIAIGVFIGTLVASFVLWRVSVWHAERQITQAAEELRRTLEIAAAEERQAAESRRRQEEMRQRQELARRSQAASERTAIENARRRAASEAERRETAWQAFYRKPASCDEARGGSWTVDCANDFIRAKKRFAELFDAGKL